jgi:hypothetical protein
MNFGTACHDYVLEGKLPPVAPQVDRRTKDGKAEYNAFAAKHVGKPIISQSEWDTIQSMHGSIYAHPVAKKLLSKGRAEVTVIWQYEGHLCKARIDWLTDTGQPVDLKTTTSARPHAFSKSIQQYNYHRQAAWYLKGLQLVGLTAETFTFIAVEKSSPYLCNVFQIEQDWVDVGMNQMDCLVAQYTDLRKDAPYPAYTSPEIITLATPSYLKEWSHEFAN